MQTISNMSKISSNKQSTQVLQHQEVKLQTPIAQIFIYIYIYIYILSFKLDRMFSQNKLQ